MSSNDKYTSVNDTFSELSSHASRMKDGVEAQYRNQGKELAKFPPRILLVGPSGVGKSTLVNTVFFGLGPKERAKVRPGGRPCTTGFSEYGPSEQIPVIIVDSKSIEGGSTAHIFEYVRLKNKNTRTENHVHVAWYVPDQRWEPRDTLCVRKLEDNEVKVVIVLTMSDQRMMIGPNTNLTAVENYKLVIAESLPGVPVVACATPPQFSIHWLPWTCPRGHSNKTFAVHFPSTFEGMWFCGGDKNGTCNEEGTEKTGPFGHLELIERTIEIIPACGWKVSSSR